MNPAVFMDANEDALDRIDNKAGSLLTHISMMVAAASFMVGAADTSTLERVVIGFEITLYLFFALLCLRCLSFRDLASSRDQSTRAGSLARYRHEMRREVVVRSILLNLSIRWVFLITFVFLLSVFVHLVL